MWSCMRGKRFRELLAIKWTKMNVNDEVDPMIFSTFRAFKYYLKFIIQCFRWNTWAITQFSAIIVICNQAHSTIIRYLLTPEKKEEIE